MDLMRIPFVLEELRALPGETEWVEFKVNNTDPEQIGEYLSALSNTAALLGRDVAWMVWGLHDSTHEIVGTDFRPRRQRKGGEELENWLLRLLVPRIDFHIHELEVEGRAVVLFEVSPARISPVSFSGHRYIRVGSCKKPLREFPEKERALWAIFSTSPFEEGVAARDIDGQRVLELLDYPGCFRLMGLPMPDGLTGILNQLEKERLVGRTGPDAFEITNIAAILFARDIGDFTRLGRKAARVVVYPGRDRASTLKEREGRKGYAVGFEGLLAYIDGLLPSNEEIRRGLRREVPVYPQIAVRELVANALVHQDFSLTGTGPMVEIFADRMEITNPGLPLIDTLRFMDEPPVSRNEALARMMRRMNIIEERGSGIDKTITAIELFQLPAPDFQTTSAHTKAVLFAPRPLEKMEKGERLRACYQHACLKWVAGDRMSNESLRKRFDIAKPNYPMASRILKETVDAGLIKLADTESGSPRDRRYVPFWA